MSYMTNKFVNIIKKILLFPYYLAIKMRKLIINSFRTLHFSIKKKITLNYLILYVITSIFTYICLFSGYILLELSDKNNEIYLYMNSIIEKYEDKTYDLNELDYKINALAETNNIGIQLIINDDIIIVSDELNSYSYPNNAFEKIAYIIKYKIYSSELSFNFIDENTGEVKNVSLKTLIPFEPLFKTFNRLSIILLITTIFGFFFIWVFGGINNRNILKPIYIMTKTAEKISIRNKNELLDVSQAKYELKDLAITLNDMIERLHNDYEKQKRFVSDVSHELRTPISIVAGYTNMLKRWGKLDEEILDESIEALISEAKNMQILVENLLTLVRSDNQTLKFNKEEFYLNELIEEVVKESQMINTKNQSITCIVNNPIKVYMDYQMIKQTLRIFVDNAVKYTKENGEINIKCYEKNNYIYIHVKDNGIGMSKYDLEHIFDRFYRSDESRTRETGGHGLGLSIAKAIILGHGGKIKVKSKEHEGSEFISILPISC